jgi:hypothetical protein
MMISTQTRFVLGCILLGLGVLCGLTVPFLSFFHVTHNKAAIISFLMLSHHGLTFLSIAVMGQANFERLTEPVHKAAAKAGEKIKPAGNVSRERYKIGLIMLVTPLIVVTAMHLLNEFHFAHETRVAISLVMQTMFLASFFVLGGDFWDKARALFVWDARAVFPEDEHKKHV